MHAERRPADSKQKGRVVRAVRPVYHQSMQLIRIRFSDRESKRRALGFLAGRFSFTSYASGEILVVESALSALALEGISFTAEGSATYAEAIPAFRTTVADQVQ
jgi:hypothetical protein